MAISTRWERGGRITTDATAMRASGRMKSNEAALVAWDEGPVREEGDHHDDHWLASGVCELRAGCGAVDRPLSASH